MVEVSISSICKKCFLSKPPRTHHCNVCKSCQLKMDHHCRKFCMQRNNVHVNYDLFYFQLGLIIVLATSIIDILFVFASLCVWELFMYHAVHGVYLKIVFICCANTIL